MKCLNFGCNKEALYHNRPKEKRCIAHYCLDHLKQAQKFIKNGIWYDECEGVV